jgi:hypothetical protein
MTTARDVRSWLLARGRAADVERRLAREAAGKGDSIGLALDLISLVENLHGWPPPSDPVSARENEAVRTTWARIRRNWVLRQT